MTVARKLYIKTFGCQMNEYDSAKMADVLAAAEGMESTADPAEADVMIVQHLLGARKSAGEGVPRTGRVKHLKQARPGLVIGVGGCVASQEGAAIVARSPYVDVVFGPQTLHRLPALIEARLRTGKAQVDISFPEIEKIRRPAAGENRRRIRLCLHHGGLQQVLQLLRRTLYTRRGSLASLRGCAHRSRGTVAGRGQGVTLLGQNVNAYRGNLGGEQEERQRG